MGNWFDVVLGSVGEGPVGNNHRRGNTARDKERLREEQYVRHTL